jgi:Flp pilus assembly protein TadG
MTLLARAFGGLLKRRLTYLRDARGSTAITFALALPAMLGAGGAAIDYASTMAAKAKLQAVADGAALASAKELRLGNSSATTATQVARAYVTSALPDPSVVFSDSVASDNSSITVNLQQSVQTNLLQFVNASLATVHASATAKVVGGQPICVVALEAQAYKTIYLQQNASINASGCSIYSNSKSKFGIVVMDKSAVTAAFACSAGGVAIRGGKFAPSPMIDCPPIPDPLASRAPPTYSGCSQTNLAITSGATTLYPGVYCGGLSISGGATVNLASGVYIIKDGSLTVTGGATLKGTNVGFYLTGSQAFLDFETQSTIDLSAPTTGVLAGFLVFGDRAASGDTLHTGLGNTTGTGRPWESSSSDNWDSSGGGNGSSSGSSSSGSSSGWSNGSIGVHYIVSNNARNLLGTIYLPNGRLFVGAQNPIADQSAYTIVVARQFSLAAGPTMVLNSNYSATDVPVPDNLGPNATKAYLSN